MKVQILGIDFAKNVFQLHGVDRKGRSVRVRRVRREQLMGVIGELLGHAVKIMAPQYVHQIVRDLLYSPRLSIDFLRVDAHLERCIA
jgi:transposase